MSYLHRGICRVFCIVVFTGVLVATTPAEEYPPQEMISLPVKVVNEDGRPVAGVNISPWALRSSQGHGTWPESVLGKIPEDMTDAEGRADVVYPRYKIPGEFVRTTEVTLSVNHPDFVYISHEDVAVPREDNEPHAIIIKRGGTLEILPTLDGKPLDPKEVYAIWSDERSWQKDSAPRVNPDGRLAIPSMTPGPGQVLLARVVNGKATHFSPIQSVQSKAGETQHLDLELRLSITISGRFSDAVPRPVKSGRVVARTLAKDHEMDNVMWGSWAQVNDDGTFELEGWPADEAIQLIALCDGYIAQSGSQPEEVDTPPRERDPFQRPQVFRPEQFEEPLAVEMEPMVECVVTVFDDQDNPLVDADVGSYPNVCWWNSGSQIYCGRLFRSVECAEHRDYQGGTDTSMPLPFTVKTDEQGVAHLFLPADKTESIVVDHETHELTVVRGRREVRIKTSAGETDEIRLILQPKGKEFLGEWDKLAGVLFGCTGEECRRLLNDPGFRERITAVRIQLDEAKDMNDPKLLENAFAEISAAFDEVGDQEEVARWRRKADEQAGKLNAK